MDQRREDGLVDEARDDDAEHRVQPQHTPDAAVAPDAHEQSDRGAEHEDVALDREVAEQPYEARGEALTRRVRRRVDVLPTREDERDLDDERGRDDHRDGAEPDPGGERPRIRAAVRPVSGARRRRRVTHASPPHRGRRRPHPPPC
ncbi:hypothetical protein B5808_15910 [Cnuibacter physcomitrellae]|uniref:Uncharacterized protein n=1 Tax=Cnuibacter physcomitrellae TaxID=1619308 RepID=A0A1X9LTM2_9MICO|nr:hypothetical protein B5808_15910 [Cnuibacter physcomitrellae]